jgi:hypothetical protein
MVTADREVRRVAAEAWSFRARVELEAEARFRRLAGRLLALGGSASLVELAARSAEDEHRHAALCVEIAREHGCEAQVRGSALREIAPDGLTSRGAVLYELVAACCITETESMAVLTTLLGAVRAGSLRRTLRELSSDEVRHSRLGWAHLASEHASGVTAFLAPLVPAMLDGNAPPDLFADVGPEREDERLLRFGVLPHALKREVFVETLEQVVFPGLERFGVDTAAARAWLSERRRPG